MDQELYRNTLAGRYAGADLSAVLSEQTALTQGIGLGTAFPAQLSASASRSYGPLPGHAGHVLHGDSHLHNIAAQGGYKGLPVTGQPTFADPYAAIRLTSQAPNVPSSKPLYVQEGVTQPGILETGQKTWGLSNFVADLPGVDFQTSLALGQGLLNPPPAHSAKVNHLSQRMPFGTSDLFSRSTKSPPNQQAYDHRSQSTTPVSTQSVMFPYSQSQAFISKSDMLIDSMNYEAVSPATTPGPEHSNQSHHQQNETYLSLQDLASISSTQQKLEVNTPQQHTIQKRPSPIVPDRQNKMQHLKNQKAIPQQEMYNGSSHVARQSPQSNVGSPLVPMGSPQAAVPSTTVVQALPPVQAPADSTTKPKKSRSRKKKDNNDMKQDNFSQQNVLSSPEMGQRTSEFLPNHQFLQQQSTRSQQQNFTVGNSVVQNAQMMNAPMNQTMVRPHNPQTVYAKNVPSPSMNNTQTNVQNRLPQQTPMLSPFQSSLPNSQTSGTFSVSDALGMSREAVFPNQGLLEGYSESDLQPYALQEPYTNQLSMESVRRQDMFNGTEENVFITPYGQFVSPNSVLNMDVVPTVSANQSTIDEAAFSSLMNESNYVRDGSPEKRPMGMDTNSAYSLTVRVEAEEDDDLSHLAKPLTEKKDSATSQNQMFTSNQPTFTSLAQNPPLQPPPAAPKPMVKNASGGTSFMDSYLSFIQGKKPETLSSMSSAIIHNKPQLPKYIPEPPRPKRVEPLPEKSAEKPVTKTSDKTQKSNTMAFSDTDEDSQSAESSKAVQKAISTLNSENENVKISTNKSGGLTMKINLNKVKKAEETARLKAAKQKKPRSRKKSEKKEVKFGLKAQYRGTYSSGEEEESEIVPARQLSSRKAKENVGKYAEEDDSDSDTLKPIRKLGEESDEENYDSDKDPAWTPSNADSKKPSTFETTERKRPRGKIKSKGSKSRKLSGEGFPINPQRVGEPQVVEVDSGSDDEQAEGVPSESLQVGEFVIEGKDEKSSESFPIWKVESGRMLHKFELFLENSRILHRSIPTFSSWQPNTHNSYRVIRVRQVLKSGDKEHVEVFEEDRPKPALDKKLEEKYEEHPLVDAFNVYLQIFLSQALEPGFLSAIREADERFYLDALEKIDSAVGVRLTEIDKTVRWRDKFKEAVKLHPHIREIDRPNLKQSCQACEFASQPAIKSVHLFGNPYDRFSLQEITSDVPHAPMEFMIGKTASKYVKPYHNLYHFKYNLFKRCQAKVNILQDSKAGDNAAILDQCLQNRPWVLQIFEDLKQMLEKG